MKILIIRHADPDYELDSLTEKGFMEAALLTKRLEKTEIDDYYMSPLGRAQATAKPILKLRKKTAQVMPWLREFEAPVLNPETGERRIPWDQLPEVWTREEKNYLLERWGEVPLMQSGNVLREAKWVWNGLDDLLKEQGYKRENNYYRTECGTRKTIALFCHFGVECVILAHLLNISPVVLWHGMCAAPSSVTTLVTEERREGIAYFRMSSFGDISHLYEGDEEPSFAARFCENFHSQERHD